MRTAKKLFFLFTSMLITIFVFAQDAAGKTAFGETMRSSGRIYVVLAVMLTILAGLILYLVRLDRKVGRIEKEI
jgi:hypothetical protein